MAVLIRFGLSNVYIVEPTGKSVLTNVAILFRCQIQGHQKWFLLSIKPFVMNYLANMTNAAN